MRQVRVENTLAPGKMRPYPLDWPDDSGTVNNRESDIPGLLHRVALEESMGHGLRLGVITTWTELRGAREKPVATRIHGDSIVINGP
jgi:hypothetical protein